MKPYLPLFLSSLCLSLGSCSSPTVTAIAFDATTYSIEVGETMKLRVLYTGSGKTAAFFSSNDLVASIDKDGNLKGVSKGEATIFAVCNDHIARASVLVSGKATMDHAYRRKGNLNLAFHAPSIAAEGSVVSPFTITFKDPLTDGFCFDHELPSKDILQSCLNFASSPLILENPDITLPASYEAYKAAIGKLLESEGKYSVRHLLHENDLTSYFFRDGTYVSKANNDVTSALENIRLLSMLSQADLSSLTLHDIVSLLKEALPEGESSYEGKGGAGWFFEALSAATYSTKNAVDSLTFLVTVGTDFGSDLSEFFPDIDFGDSGHIKSELAVEFKAKSKVYDLAKVTLRSAVKLFGIENSVSLAIDIPEEKETVESSVYDKIVEELEAYD